MLEKEGWRGTCFYFKERVNTLLETCKIVKSKILYVKGEGGLFKTNYDCKLLIRNEVF